MIEWYDKCLIVVFRHQVLTLVVALGTVALTVVLYIVIPKGFFPVQDNGLIQAVTEAPQSISFDAMSERQRALADIILKDPDVESLTSFVGVDGTNPTLNSGRMLINLKPRDARTLSASQIIRRIQRETSSLPGITLYMQPAQDLTIDSTVSRDPVPVRPGEPQPRRLRRLGAAPDRPHGAASRRSPTSPATCRTRAWRSSSGSTATRRRASASPPATVDNVLYDAFGQRIVSTIYTQSNQYRVIYEVDPADGPQSSIRSTDLYLPASTAGEQVPLVGDRHLRASGRRRFGSIASASSRPPPSPSTWRRAPRSAPRSMRSSRRQKEIGLPRQIQTHFQGAALAFQKALDSQLLLILAAIVTVYIVLGVLYESYIHPITILSTLPSAGIGALLGADAGGPRSQRRRHHRHRAADRHRQEERDHDDRLRARRRAQRGQGAAGGDPPGLPAALPADPDDDHRRAGRRAAADAGHRRSAPSCASRSASPSWAA